MVFNGDQGIGHIVRKFRHAHLVAEERALFRKHRAVFRQQHDAGLQFGYLQKPLLVQREPDIAKHRRKGDAAEDRGFEGEGKKPAEETSAAAVAAALNLLRRGVSCGQKAAAPAVHWGSAFFCRRIVPSSSLAPIGSMPLMGLII